MPDIGIIGSRDIISLFKFLGFEIYPAENAGDARSALAKVIKEKRLKIVFVLESLAAQMKAELMEVGDLDDITVVPLPDHKSEVSFLDDELKRFSKEAIGMEI